MKTTHLTQTSNNLLPNLIVVHASNENGQFARIIEERRKDMGFASSNSYRGVFHEIFIVNYDVTRAIEVVECLYGC